MTRVHGSCMPRASMTHFSAHLIAFHEPQRRLIVLEMTVRRFELAWPPCSSDPKQCQFLATTPQAREAIPQAKVAAQGTFGRKLNSASNIHRAALPLLLLSPPPFL